MKNITYILIFLMTNLISSQKITIKNIESKLITNQGIEFIGELKDVEDNTYVFPNWKNHAILYVNNNKYILNNINFNVESNSFESRINRNQLFSYGKFSIDSVSINGRLFKIIGSYFYEVLHENGNNLFLKKYDVKYQEGAPSRLGKKPSKSKSMIDYKYLAILNNDFNKIELNKKSISNLFKNNKEELENFVKEQKLSYKKEQDIVIIFNHMI